MGQAPPNKGRREPWAGGWGVLGDKRSRVAKLARTIERSLRQEYRASRPLWKARLQTAAEFTALGRAMLDAVGRDPAATAARASKLLRTSDHLLRDIPKRPPRRATDLAAALAREARR
jgi:hypothetical protein